MYLDECAYVGTAPVPFDDYLQSVAAQTIANEHPREADLRRAFADLLIPEETFRLLGPAINSGQGLFLYGYPGNGKTSIAERITRCFETTVWIPQVIWVEGQIIKLFDFANHEPIAAERSEGLLDESDYDRRWVQIKRPTIVVGGELRMEDLEIHFDPVTKVSEAPLQLKSNLGTFLIDDFGRQQMQPVELLNRWIVPLERHYDFLSLANGKKIRVPFDQLIIFSTNLEPAELVDEAFLRRIPYKIHATDPTEEMFRKLIAMCAPKLGFDEVDRAAIDYLVDAPLSPRRAPVPLLPAARSLASGAQLLHLQRPSARAHARVLRFRRNELLHGDVRRALPRILPCALTIDAGNSTHVQIRHAHGKASDAKSVDNSHGNDSVIKRGLRPTGINPLAEGLTHPTNGVTSRPRAV